MAREADLVFVGGRVFTAARVRPWAEGMAIRNDRFVAVGTESQVERWTGRQTRRIDLHGRVVVPGFIDAHAHMADSAGEIGWTRLSGTRSMEDALARLRKAAANTPAGEWVVGIDWDEAKWTDRRYPTRVDLDRVSTDRPVVARRIDCHMGSVNSLALERARDLVGLRGFDVDGSGRPTGILKEDAFSELHDRFASGPAVIERNLPRIARMAHRLGITSIHDVVPMPAWQAYQRAHRRGGLRLRVYAMVPGTATDSLAQTAIQSGLGDEALRLVTETLASVAEENPRETLRHRIEHYELPDEDVLRQTKQAGLVASCQPNFIGQWSGPGDVYEDRLGSVRMARNNPYRRIARLGIPLCFGSDGMPYGPLYGIHWAVNGYFEDQRISPEEAFRAYTAGGAYASFEELQKGTLETGKFADFVVLEGNPFHNPETIDRCHVRETWIGGVRVFPVSKSG